MAKLLVGAVPAEAYESPEQRISEYLNIRDERNAQAADAKTTVALLLLSEPLLRQKVFGFLCGSYF